ncbi:MAG: DEAD/DEAH box helicase [Chitinispirillaceae bacterium]|nr:DEAD/DEAH box helicase [Chitinispirillaceae bacterium]
MTLFERLSRLTHRQAVKLLGPNGEKLLVTGGRLEIDLTDQVILGPNVFRLTLPDATVSIVDDNHSVDKLRILCSSCTHRCEHIGAAFSLLLEEKTALGLAHPPPDAAELIDLTEEELTARELLRRTDRANKERMTAKPVDGKNIWTDYVVTNRESGKSYRVALRGWERGESYCSCPDFRKNTLGTCKHILYVIERTRKRFPHWKKMAPFTPSSVSVYLRYNTTVELQVQLPGKTDPATTRKMRPFTGKEITDIPALLNAVAAITARGTDVIIYPDAEQFITMQLHRQKIEALVAAIGKDPERHPLRKGLLHLELLPYQLEGIAFAVGIGRAVLADDMGLGKTIQGVGTAELLARECDIKKVLVVCPASVKSQWKSEIGRYCDRTAAIVAGSAADRHRQYHDDTFFTICNYEQVLRDLQAIGKARWDLIILDEGQRIKNWEAKTSRVIKGLQSTYALVLSGTPLENRLEELYSVLEFIDDRRLGPDFRFAHRFRIDDSRGKVTGYKNLDHLRELLRPVLLRRTRAQVLQQLPPRTTEIVRIEPSEEQCDIHGAQKRIINQIVNKKHLTEMDLLRLQKALLLCRMVADSTFLVNKQLPGHSTKLQRLRELVGELYAQPDRKIVLFSEWTTMLDIIEKQILRPLGAGYVRLDGSVPQKKRQALVHTFQSDDTCRLFLTTNAGSTGLNLQAANTVINVDLPWNPAVLEQRIGRAHRMGQKRPVHVYLLVTEQTIEESMLGTLAAKKDLSLAALDLESGVNRVSMTAGIDELKKRLELLLADKPVAPVDESEQQRVEAEAQRLSRAQAMEKSGGELITAMFSFMRSVIPSAQPVDGGAIEQFKTGLMTAVTQEEDGGISMKIRLPDAAAIEEMAKTMAVFGGMVAGNNNLKIQ